MAEMKNPFFANATDANGAPDLSYELSFLAFINGNFGPVIAQRVILEMIISSQVVRCSQELAKSSDLAKSLLNELDAASSREDKIKIIARCIGEVAGGITFACGFALKGL